MKKCVLFKILLVCFLLGAFTIFKVYGQQSKDQEIEKLKNENASLKKDLNELYREYQILKIDNEEWEYLFEVTTHELQLAVKKYIYAVQWSQGKTSKGQELTDKSNEEFSIIMDRIKQKLTEYKQSRE